METSLSAGPCFERCPLLIKAVDDTLLAQFLDPGPRQKFDHCMTLLDYVQKKKNLESWYCFNDEFYTQLRDCQFTFIRSLGEKPFDPIAMSNVIDPEVQFKAWEHAGLLAAAPVQFQLDVKNGALPSPIINEIKHGALASGMG